MNRHLVRDPEAENRALLRRMAALENSLTEQLDRAMAVNKLQRQFIEARGLTDEFAVWQLARHHAVGQEREAS